MRLPGFTAEASVCAAPGVYNKSFTRNGRCGTGSVIAQTTTFPVDYDYWARIVALMTHCHAPICQPDFATGSCYCHTDIAPVGGPL